jgi:hypothetical protein
MISPYIKARIAYRSQITTIFIPINSIYTGLWLLYIWLIFGQSSSLKTK